MFVGGPGGPSRGERTRPPRTRSPCRLVAKPYHRLDNRQGARRPRCKTRRWHRPRPVVRAPALSRTATMVQRRTDHEAKVPGQDRAEVVVPG